MKKFSMQEIVKLENKQYEKQLNRIHRTVYKYAKHGHHRCIVECSDNVMASRIMCTLHQEGLIAQIHGYSHIEITWG